MKKRYLIFVLCAFFTVFGLASCKTDKKDDDKTDQVAEYTVTFQANGGSTVQSKTVKQGEKVTKPTDPTKEGYDFKGWYKDSACTNEWKFDTDTVKGNTTLYAKWEAKETPPTPTEKYSITYVSEHGTAPANVAEAIALPATLPTIADVTGWKFEGWYTKNTYEESSKAVGGTPLTGNITLYAKWTDLNKKTITGVTFTSKTVVYDGTEQSILIAGTLPTGVTARYTNNKATNAGVYNASVTLSGDEYNSLTLTATLTISKATLPNLTFEDAVYTYDGTSYSISVVGTLPANTNVSYSCRESSSIRNEAIHAGVYHITASVTNPNYITATYDAVLTINKATISDDGISFSNETFSYDGTPHTIEIVGQLPEGSIVTYTCAENSEISYSATETGTYTITATITHQDYTTKTLTATLKITASDDERHITYFNGKLYFANALDKDKFYSYDSSNGIEKVSSDTPYNFTVVNGSLYFRSYSIFASSIKTLSTRVETVASEKGEYLCTDGTYLYYAVNGLTQNKSGIYRINPTSSEPTPTLISSGKAKYLQYKSGYLYFADGANGWKLSRVSVSGGDRSLVVDEKINCLTIEGNYLFFTVNNLLGDYIANYNLSTNTLRKLTIDAGSNLTIIGNDLYYLNVDLVTSSIFGKGIYKVNAYPTGDRQLPGTKVIGETGENYSSLTLVDDQIAYYKVSTQMLCLFNLDTEAETEVLAGFTAPEVTPLSTGSKTLAYKDRLYYLD
ncbi:MAG: InlB B-repeat-containing protein, partial [Anaeroplasmataceae bacterium]|nr:InlB B-repeat-containing protein [Anaeroplasmataceae bacterium]